jgi:hypothetical protein
MVAPRMTRRTGVVAAEEDLRALYAGACAAIAASSSFLVEAHRIGGQPHRPHGDSIDLQIAIAHGRTGAGALAVVAGRLMPNVRQWHHRVTPDLPPVEHAEPGFTVADLPRAHQTTHRALEAADVELTCALKALPDEDDTDALRAKLHELQRVTRVLIDMPDHMIES